VTECSECDGDGVITTWVSGLAPMDPDAETEKHACGACKGSGMRHEDTEGWRHMDE